MENFTYIGNRYHWLGGIFETLGIPSGSTPTLGESDPSQAHLFFNTSTGLLQVWDGTQWLNVGAGFDIVNIGSGSPDPLQPNTIQVKSTGEVFFVDKDGDVQQIEFIPVDSVKLNKLLAATASNTINNGSFTQEWQFNMPNGGTGFKLTDTRAASGSTAETLMQMLITGTGTPSRPVTGLDIEVAQPTPGKSAVYTTLNVKLTNIPGTPVFSSAVHSAIRVSSDAAGLEILKSLLGIRVVSTGRAIDAVGDMLISINPTASSSAASIPFRFVNGAPKTVQAFQITAGGTSATALDLQGRLAVGLFESAAALITSLIAIAGANTGYASINIGEAIAPPTTPQNGDIWRIADDIFIHLDGVTYSMIGGGGGGGTAFYVSDGTISANRTVNVDSKTLDFTNVSRFRITDDGSDTGIYDFNNGVDFLVANAAKSFSILTSLAGGIELRGVDITGGITRFFKITEIGISIFLPEYADNAAAIAAGLANDTLYRTPDGVVRTKQASVSGGGGGGGGTAGPGISANGQGGVIQIGSLQKIVFPYACTLAKWFIVSDVVGSIVFDIKKNGVSMVGAGTKPNLTAQDLNSATISGWTSVSIAEGDVIEYVVDSASTVTKATLSFKI